MEFYWNMANLCIKGKQAVLQQSPNESSFESINLLCVDKINVLSGMCQVSRAPSEFDLL